MIAFDTNMLVRHLVPANDVQQLAALDQVRDQAIATGETIFVSQIVLCELVWVWASRYRQPKQVIISAMEELLLAGNVEIEGAQEVIQALDDYRDGPGDFADYMIAQRAAAAGCDQVLTFDSDLWPHPRFVAPEKWARR